MKGQLRSTLVAALLAAGCSGSDGVVHDSLVHDSAVHDSAVGDAVVDGRADSPLSDQSPQGCKDDNDCDDGNGCNGDERCDKASGDCLPAQPWTCPVAPPECNQSGGGPVPSAKLAQKLTGIAGFRLRDEAKWTASYATIAAIEAHSSTTAVTLDTVLKNLNRQGDQGAKPVLHCLDTWFRWNTGDNMVAYWYPQGTTGSATGAPGVGHYNGRQLLLVSWYHKPDQDPSTSINKGVRVSVADVTTIANSSYRHLLLVEPTGSAGYKPVVIHAGGIAWYKGWLYVADTSKGLRVFDINRLIEVKTGDKDAIGLVTSKNEYHAFGYRYVLPQVNRYSLCGNTCCARFSFVSVDLTSTPPSLITGEYSSGNIKGRLMRWPLDPKTGKLQTRSGAVASSGAYLPGLVGMQGGTVVGNRLWIASGADTGSFKGSLFTGLMGKQITATGYPRGPEDLHYAPGSTRLWSNTEFPSSRYVFSVNTAQLLGGCR